jgi:hypothetical protein
LEQAVSHTESISKSHNEILGFTVAHPFVNAKQKGATMDSLFKNGMGCLFYESDLIHND